MKTTDQIKQEVINYLDKTSKHTFIKPKATFKWGDSTKPGYYEYDYQNGSIFKVIKEGDNYQILEDGKLRKLDFEYYISYYKSNSKCVVKNNLFLEKKMKGIKNSRKVKEQISLIKETLSKI